MYARGCRAIPATDTVRHMVYALVAALVSLSIGLLVLAWQAVAVCQESQEQANREMLNRIERLIKVVSDNAEKIGSNAAKSAAEMAVEIAQALINPGNEEVNRDVPAQESVSGFETVEFPQVGLRLTEEINDFYGVGEENTEDALETERRYDPDADKYDPKQHPLAELFGWK